MVLIAVTGGKKLVRTQGSEVSHRNNVKSFVPPRRVPSTENVSRSETRTAPSTDVVDTGEPGVSCVSRDLRPTDLAKNPQDTTGLENSKSTTALDTAKCTKMGMKSRLQAKFSAPRKRVENERIQPVA